MFSDIDFDSYEDEFEDNEGEDDILVHTKWILDGASSIEEAIDLAKGFLGYLEELERNGYDLTDVASDGSFRLSTNVKGVIQESIF